MLDFHPLELSDLPKLREFFGYSGSRICDTTPGTVFMWRDMYKTEWAIYDGSLYFKVDYPGLGATFTLPLGGGRPEHYRQIAEYCCRRSMPIAFYPVPKDELDRLQQAFPNSAAIPNRDTFDYLYRAEGPDVLPGKKLSGQRNHVNKFLKTYGNWAFRVITHEDLPAVALSWTATPRAGTRPPPPSTRTLPRPGRCWSTTTPTACWAACCWWRTRSWASPWRGHRRHPLYPH